MTEQTVPGLYCSDLSSELDEPMPGTVKTTSGYLLVEHNYAPGVKALEESALPEDLKQKLKGFAKTNPQYKTLLIRNHRSLLQPGIRFFAARSEPPAALYDFHVGNYEDLLDLDLQAILDGSSEFDRWLSDAPLYLICTNGRRDRCCARFGSAVFTELINATQEYPRFEVWQCSHVGGHRFAANLIYLPAGIWYGRMRPEDIPALLSAHLAGEIYLPRLRGRAAYPPVVQAAEAALLGSADQSEFQGLRLDGAEETAAGKWNIAFETSAGTRFIVQAIIRIDDRWVYESCLQDKTTPITRYTFELKAG